MRILARSGERQELSAAVGMQRGTFVVDVHNFSIFHGGKTLGIKTVSCIVMTIYKAHTEHSNRSVEPEIGLVLLIPYQLSVNASLENMYE